VQAARGGLKAESNTGDDQEQDDGNLAAAEPCPPSLRAVARPELVPDFSQPQENQQERPVTRQQGPRVQPGPKIAVEKEQAQGDEQDCSD